MKHVSSWSNKYWFEGNSDDKLDFTSFSSITCICSHCVFISNWIVWKISKKRLYAKTFWFITKVTLPVMRSISCIHFQCLSMNNAKNKIYCLKNYSHKSLEFFFLFFFCASSLWMRLLFSFSNCNNNFALFLQQIWRFLYFRTICDRRKESHFYVLCGLIDCKVKHIDLWLNDRIVFLMGLLIASFFSFQK